MGVQSLEAPSSATVPESYTLAPVEKQMAPQVRFDPDVAPDKLAEYEEEFHLLLRWIRELKVKPIGLKYKVRPNGYEAYEVEFADHIFDIRDMKEKKTLSFIAFGEHHAKKFGTEKASALAYTAYIAGRMTDPDSHLFGCGFLKWNRFHGNGSNEFWVYPKTEDFTHRLQYDDFDYTVETLSLIHI